jgi:hypothetical protein
VPEGNVPVGLTISGFSSNTALLPIIGPPSVQIESPSPGSTISGVVTVSGWAIDNLQSIGSDIGSVRVLVDGVAVGPASYGIPRVDVCTIYPNRPRCPNVGFSFQLNTQALPPGSHTISVTAANTDAFPLTSSASTTVVVASTPAIFIDSPTVGATLSGIVTVTGWAVDTTSNGASNIASVLVSLDGGTLGTANYGVSRPDACAGVFAGRPGCPNVGFMYQLDARNLSIGTHVLSVAAIDNNRNLLSGGWSVNVNVGPTPSVYIDSPSAGASVSGTITISGWAIDSTTTVGSAIGAVQVSVDGQQVGTGSYGVSRPDVCSAYPGRAGCPNVGFSYSLNTALLSGGAHTITVSATDTDASPDSGSASVTVNVSSTLAMNLESPTGGSVVGGSVTLSGWAVAPPGANIASVNVMVDGTLNGTATYGASRPDICAGYPGAAACPNVGFVYTLNTTAFAAGPHLVTVVATDNESTPQTNSVNVMINVSGALSLYVESPGPGAAVSGMVTLTGWALGNPGGAPVTILQVYVDDHYMGLASYGMPRADVCTAYPGRPGCPNVGFTYPIDVSQLSAGTHTLKITVLDGSGAQLAPWSSTFTVVR